MNGCQPPPHLLHHRRRCVPYAYVGSGPTHLRRHPPVVSVLSLRHRRSHAADTAKLKHCRPSYGHATPSQHCHHHVRCTDVPRLRLSPLWHLLHRGRSEVGRRRKGGRAWRVSCVVQRWQPRQQPCLCCVGSRGVVGQVEGGGGGSAMSISKRGCGPGGGGGTIAFRKRNRRVRMFSPTTLVTQPKLPTLPLLVGLLGASDPPAAARPRPPTLGRPPPFQRKARWGGNEANLIGLT